MLKKIPRFRLTTLFAMITIIAFALAYYRAMWRVPVSKGEFSLTVCYREKWTSFAKNAPHFTKGGLRVFTVDRTDLPAILEFARLRKNSVDISYLPNLSRPILSSNESFVFYPRIADESLPVSGKRPMERQQVAFSTSLRESVFSPRICFVEFELAIVIEKTLWRSSTASSHTDTLLSDQTGIATPTRYQHQLRFEHRQRDKILIVEGPTGGEDENVMLFIYDLP